MSILPDYLDRGLLVVFCGTAAGKKSATRKRYYSGAGNEFWRYLYQSGLTKEQLSPEMDYRVCEFGCGLTDLAKHVAANSDRALKHHYSVEDFLQKVERDKPLWIAFHGKEAARQVSKQLHQRSTIRLGRQDWSIRGVNVFVLPSASGANRDPRRLEGKSDRLAWFTELANLLAGSRK